MKLNSPMKQGVWYYSMNFRIYKDQPSSQLDPVQNSCHLTLLLIIMVYQQILFNFDKRYSSTDTKSCYKN